MFVNVILQLYQRLARLRKTRGLLILLVFMSFHSISFSKERPLELIYGRIHLNIDPSDSALIKNKSFIDSVFKIAEVNYQDLESLLGYKSSLQYSATIYSDINEYHKALNLHAIWQERTSGLVLNIQEYNYPIYSQCSYSQLQKQFVYTLSHFLFHEFLLGINVRQKLSRTGSHTIPNWFLPGLSSYLAAGWNSQSADEYAFYESSGGFKSPNQIVPMGAQVYGMKIWHDLFKTYGKSVVSTIMFVLKYTGNSESAIEYVTGKSFAVWNAERNVNLSVSSKTSIQSELELPLKFREIPIRKILQNGENFIIQWYTPGLIEFSFFNLIDKNARELIRYEYPSIMEELDFPPIGLVGFVEVETSSSNPNSTKSSLISFDLLSHGKRRLVMIDRTGEIKHIVNLGESEQHPVHSILIANQKLGKESHLTNDKVPFKYTVVSNFLGDFRLSNFEFELNESTIPKDRRQTLNQLIQQKVGLFDIDDRHFLGHQIQITKPIRCEKLAMERLDFANEKGDSTYYAIDLQKINNDQWGLFFVQWEDGKSKVLRTDTFDEKPLIRGLVVEGQGQLSYVQSDNEVWRLRFYHFKDNSDFRWQSEVKNSFYFQSKSSETENIVESSFASSKTSIRLLDPAKETNRELELLAKHKSIIHQSRKDPSVKIMPDSSDRVPLKSSWEYLVGFPKRTWSSFPNRESLNRYSGKFDIQAARNTYYLRQGGLYFSNAEYSMPFLNEIKQHFLYNQPLTPEMRFYLMDKNHSYRMAVGILSNIGLNRLGLRLSQSFSWRKYIVDQNIMIRNRSFYSNEMSLKKNASNFFNISISRNWLSNLNCAAGFQMMEDFYYDKVVNPGISSMKNYRFQTAGLLLGLSWHNKQWSMRKEKSWQITVNSQAKINRNSTATIIPNRAYIHGNVMGSSYVFSLNVCAYKPLIRGVNFKFNMVANKSSGRVLTLYWLGGSEGWMSNNMWRTDISSEYSNSKYLYRSNGGYVRGFLVGERIGTGSLSVQNEIQFHPFKHFKQSIIKQHFYESITVYGFLDFGTAFIGNSPSNPTNPFNTIAVNTPNYLLTVTAKRNPYLIGTGLGISANVLRTPIRYEMALGFKEGKMMSPIQQVCMSWFF